MWKFQLAVLGAIAISPLGINPTIPLFSDHRFHNVGVAAHKQDFAQLATRAANSSSNPAEID